MSRPHAASAGAALIWSTCPGLDCAKSLAKSMLDERLIACANIHTNITALFDWNGERHEAMEAGVLMKTDASLLEAAIRRLAALHPYDEPAIVGWRCDAASPATIAWLGELAR